MASTYRGYVRVYVPGHPLMPRKGHSGVGVHRLVLFDALGGDINALVPCWWCGYELPWKAPADVTPGWKYAVNVDHLNEQRDDNRPENLAPACGWCNANRSWAQHYPEQWTALTDKWRHVHPADRPEAAPIIGQQLGLTPDENGRVNLDVLKRLWEFL